MAFKLTRAFRPALKAAVACVGLSLTVPAIAVVFHGVDFPDTIARNAHRFERLRSMERRQAREYRLLHLRRDTLVERAAAG